MSPGLPRRLSQVIGAYEAVIASPSYFPLWLGQLVSNFGDTLHYIALVVLVFQLTGQGLAVAGLVAAEVVPVLVLGPVAGVLIDRFGRKAILIGADLVRAALVPTAALAAGCGSVARLSRCCWPGCRQYFLQSDRTGRHPRADHEEQRLAANFGAVVDRPAGPDSGVSGGGW